MGIPSRAANFSECPDRQGSGLWRALLGVNFILALAIAAAAAVLGFYHAIVLHFS